MKRPAKDHVRPWEDPNKLTNPQFQEALVAFGIKFNPTKRRSQPPLPASDKLFVAKLKIFLALYEVDFPAQANRGHLAFLYDSLVERVNKRVSVRARNATVTVVVPPHIEHKKQKVNPKPPRNISPKPTSSVPAPESHDLRLRSLPSLVGKHSVPLPKSNNPTSANLPSQVGKSRCTNTVVSKAYFSPYDQRAPQEDRSFSQTLRSPSGGYQPRQSPRLRAHPEAGSPSHHHRSHTELYNSEALVTIKEESDNEHEIPTQVQDPPPHTETTALPTSSNLHSSPSVKREEDLESPANSFCSSSQPFSHATSEETTRSSSQETARESPANSFCSSSQPFYHATSEETTQSSSQETARESPANSFCSSSQPFSHATSEETTRSSSQETARSSSQQISCATTEETGRFSQASTQQSIPKSPFHTPLIPRDHALASQESQLDFADREDLSRGVHLSLRESTEEAINGEDQEAIPVSPFQVAPTPQCFHKGTPSPALASQGASFAALADTSEVSVEEPLNWTSRSPSSSNSRTSFRARAGSSDSRDHSGDASSEPSEEASVLAGSKSPQSQPFSSSGQSPLVGHDLPKSAGEPRRSQARNARRSTEILPCRPSSSVGQSKKRSSQDHRDWPEASRLFRTEMEQYLDENGVAYNSTTRNAQVTASYNLLRASLADFCKQRSSKRPRAHRLSMHADGVKSESRPAVKSKTRVPPTEYLVATPSQASSSARFTHRSASSCTRSFPTKNARQKKSKKIRSPQTKTSNRGEQRKPTKTRRWVRAPRASQEPRNNRINFVPIIPDASTKRKDRSPDPSLTPAPAKRTRPARNDTFSNELPALPQASTSRHRRQQPAQHNSHTIHPSLHDNNELIHLSLNDGNELAHLKAGLLHHEPDDEADQIQGPSESSRLDNLPPWRLALDVSSPLPDASTASRSRKPPSIFCDNSLPDNRLSHNGLFSQALDSDIHSSVTLERKRKVPHDSSSISLPPAKQSGRSVPTLIPTSSQVGR
ncbi:hypothetical protein PtA15_12A179 [Puccinia triticina]|uniref:Uncharacterized protein n=1 Tax=Puccinia triticina TaxID=208348 RepID=A0ABY7D0R2_9BASI|nr:uncharacterized protein PtA15_12A179 [Puccinia triticina]WAQ90193.1 hypothetical protein PtA15_12A179 [Puccinia triticina]